MRTAWIALAFAAVIGCGAGSDSDSDTDGTTDTGPVDCAVARALADDPYAQLPDCFEWPIWPGACGDGGEERALTRDGLLWSTSGFYSFDGVVGGGTFTITDAATWQAFVAGWQGPEPLSVPAVDFATQVVAVLHLTIGGSCGTGLADHGALVR